MTRFSESRHDFTLQQYLGPNRIEGQRAFHAVVAP